jgi:predicted transcriptional regulator
MVKTPSPPTPTDAEIEILSVLWQRGASTVRDVYEVLAPRRRIGYTTVLKLMQIMVEKGLVRRDETQRSHLYTAAVREERVQRTLVTDLARRAFGGSASKLVMRALSAETTSKEEREEIRRLIDALERKR